MNKEIAIFRTDAETINVEVLFEDETVWLTQDQMATLFEKAKSTINEHIKHIFEEGELEKSMVVRNFRITTKHGAIEGKTQTHDVLYYNLDVIISVGLCTKVKITLSKGRRICLTFFNYFFESGQKRPLEERADCNKSESNKKGRNKAQYYF